MKPRVIGLGCALLLVVCIVIGVVAGAGGVLLTQPIAKVGDAFMAALKNGDYAAAYDLSSPALQKQLGSAQGLEKLVTNGNAQPEKWSYSSRQITGDQGTLTGSVDLTGNRPGTLNLSLVKVSGSWKISGFNLTEK